MNDSELTAAMDFGDLEPIEVPVHYRGRNYILREASEASAVRFREAAIRAAKLNDGKVVGMEGLSELEPLLVSECLYEAGEDGKLRLDDQDRPIQKNRVTIDRVRAMEARLVRKLFVRAKQISGLDEDEETPALIRKKIGELQLKLAKLERAGNGETEGPEKNGQSSTTATSGSPTS